LNDRPAAGGVSRRTLDVAAEDCRAVETPGAVQEQARTRHSGDRRPSVEKIQLEDRPAAICRGIEKTRIPAKFGGSVKTTCWVEDEVADRYSAVLRRVAEVMQNGLGPRSVGSRRRREFEYNPSDERTAPLGVATEIARPIQNKTTEGIQLVGISPRCCF
jgi:hypothetical protein